TAPGGVDRSIVHCAFGDDRLKRNVVFTFSAVAGLPETNVPIARKMSALVGTGAPPEAAAFGAALALGCGSSFHSSTAAFEMQTSPRSLILVRNSTRSPSRHISVTSVSPGSTVDANRALMLL